MNLQLVSPYKKCPYGCPFCVAATDKDYPWKDNLYETNKIEYFRRLINTIKENNIDTVVITGDTEPTLFPQWLDDCVKVLTCNTSASVKIELQTKNYNYRNDNFTIIAYSIATKYDLEKITNQKWWYDIFYGKGIRLTMLLNKKLNFYDIHTFINSKFMNYVYTDNQVTVKLLQHSAMGISNIDNYINSIIESFEEDDKQILKNIGVHIDENCMDANGRYIIYRIDGKVYKDWAELPTDSISVEDEKEILNMVEFKKRMKNN